MLNLLSLFSPFSSTSHTYTHNQKPERPQGSAFASCVCWQTSILSVSPSLSLSLPVCSIEIHSQKLSHWLVTAARSQSGFSAELSIMIWVWWPLQDGWWGMRVPGERGEGGGGSATLTSLLWVGGYGRGTLCIVEDDKGSPRWPHFAVREVFAPWETVLHMRQGILSNELKIFWKQIHSNPIRPFTVQKNKKKKHKCRRLAHTSPGAPDCLMADLCVWNWWSETNRTETNTHLSFRPSPYTNLPLADPQTLRIYWETGLHTTWSTHFRVKHGKIKVVQ